MWRGRYSSTFFLLHLFQVFPRAVRALLLAVVLPEAVRAAVPPGAAVARAVAPAARFAVAAGAVVSGGLAPGPAGAVGPRASAGIVAASAASLPAAPVAVWVDSPELPRSFASANIRYHASLSSSVEAVHWGSDHNATGVRASHGCCSILSSPGRHQNRNPERD